MKIWLSIISNIVAGIALLEFVITDQYCLLSGYPTFKLAITIGLCIFFAYIIIGLSIEKFNNSPKKCKSKEQITNQLLKFFSDDGRICIVSRNLSWSSDLKIQSKLKEKSIKNDLNIFAEKESEYPVALTSTKSSAKFYEDLQFTPKCRFTITNYKNNNALLHIAHIDDNENHLIYRYKNKDGPIYYLALDLAELLEKSIEKVGALKKQNLTLEQQIEALQK